MKRVGSGGSKVGEREDECSAGLFALSLSLAHHVLAGRKSSRAPAASESQRGLTDPHTARREELLPTEP